MATRSYNVHVMPRRYSMGTRAEAAQRTRTGIELALIRLLASKPYGTVTLADIAREADVSPRTVQRHYSTKDEILAASFSIAAREIAEETSRRPPPRSAREAIQVLVSALFAIYDRHNAEAWAAYCRAAEVPELRRAFSAGVEERRQRVQEFLSAWSSALAVQEATARSVLMASTAYLAWRATTEFGHLTSREAAALVSDVLCHYLLRGDAAV